MSSTVKTVFVGMSGGVDSSAAALILKEQGYNVVGVTMLLCPEAKESDLFISDARSVAEQLEIPFLVFDCRSTFNEQVIGPFAEEYQRGRTPNPCILCNPAIKFGAMLDFALERGADYIATGHYAKAVFDENEGLYQLRKSPSSKDQSYFLCRLGQEQLKSILFPIGEMEKGDVRSIMEMAGLSVAKKSDSQEICFIPNDDYAAFLYDKSGAESQEGDFFDASGQVIGRHKGILHYTVGQRKGLGQAFGQPMYVKHINAAANTVTLCTEAERYESFLRAGQANWIAGFPPSDKFRAQVKVRSTARPSDAEISLVGDELHMEFSSPQISVSPGQSAVMYEGDVLLGGAIILDNKK